MKTITPIFTLFVSMLVLTACSNSNTAIPEDMFEPNNDIANAMATVANTLYEGRLQDEDWFQINVTTGFERVVVNLAFIHADGDIDLELVDASGNVLATSSSTTNNEHIDFTVSSDGVYYLRLFSGNYTGNSYTLRWILDDEFEPNDSIAEATPATAGTSYAGVQFDDDWFQISVASGFERVIANLTFTHADGDIDLELVDASGNVLATSQTTSDNEQIDFSVSTGGTYYLRVFDFHNGSGNTYTLNWSSMAPPPADDAYEENDDRASATDLSENTPINGVQLDEDWYHITVQPGFERVAASLTFTNANGDLDLQLWDSNGTAPLASSLSNNNDYENIVFDVSGAGDYYLQVYDHQGVGTANSYSLTWEGRAPVDDVYEPNNNPASATDLAEGTSLSGISLDDDWYQINVSPSAPNLIINLAFTTTSGDLDIELYDPSTISASEVDYPVHLVAFSNSDTDDEVITTTVASGGTYYIRVRLFNGATGNTYDLSWTSSP